MIKLTANQIATLKTLKNEAEYTMGSDKSKKYAMSVGLNGAALHSLMSKGLIEKFDHKIYTNYYTVTKEGKKALKGV